MLAIVEFATERELLDMPADPNQRDQPADERQALLFGEDVWTGNCAAGQRIRNQQPTPGERLSGTGGS